MFSHGNQQLQSICWYRVRLCEDVFIPERTMWLKNTQRFSHCQFPLITRNNIPWVSNKFQKKADTEINVWATRPALASGGDDTDLPHRAWVLGRFKIQWDNSAKMFSTVYPHSKRLRNFSIRVRCGKTTSHSEILEDSWDPCMVVLIV